MGKVISSDKSSECFRKSDLLYEAGSVLHFLGRERWTRSIQNLVEKPPWESTPPFTRLPSTCRSWPGVPLRRWSATRN
jgi:hypothetical protein